MREELPQRDLEARGVRAGDDLDREDRVAAELEEVVVDADPLAAEHLGPDPRRATRSAGDVGGRPSSATVGLVRRGGQRAAVELAVRRQRQRVEQHERRRHHVVRQRRAEEAAQLGRGRTASRRADDVRDEPLRRRRVLACDDDRLARRPACAASAASISPSSMRKPRILTWWSSAAEELESPASGSARGRRCGTAARPAGAERIGDEALGRQLRPVAGSRARGRRRRCRARRARRSAPARRSRVEHVDLRVRDRPADRRRAPSARGSQRHAVDLDRRPRSGRTGCAAQPRERAREQRVDERRAAAPRRCTSA